MKPDDVDVVQNTLSDTDKLEYAYKPTERLEERAGAVEFGIQQTLELSVILAEFIVYLQTVKNYSARTLPTYRSTIGKLFMEAHLLSLSDITPQRIEDYFAYRISQGKSVNSNFNIMVALRAFLTFCVKRGYCDAQLALYECPRRKRVHIEYVTPDEVNRMIDVTPRERDRLMILMLYTSGCRVSELAQVTVENLRDNSFNIIAKGNKPHVYYFDKTVNERLHNYLYIEGITQGPIFTMNNGKPVGVPAIAHAIRKAAAAAQINKKVSPHKFRHGFATAALEAGADPRTIQEMMGHESIQTTMRYMHVTDSRIKESYEKFAPKVEQQNYFSNVPQNQLNNH